MRFKQLAHIASVVPFESDSLTDLSVLQIWDIVKLTFIPVHIACQTTSQIFYSVEIQ